eukprot:Seg3481.1 transcript_id=Seg3481.1/GoldUCD/mRNA.D3Y31 product="Renin receptor" protein_id=Seg3481.1/GoldUCD/D3Y31
MRSKRAAEKKVREMAAVKMNAFLAVICIIVVVEANVATCSLIGKFVHDQPQKDGAELNIINKPSSVMFARDPKPIKSDEITSILSLALGFSVPKEIQWKGLLSGNPFKLPNAVVMFTVDSVPTGEELKIQSSRKFEVKAEEDQSRTEMLALSPKRSLSSHISEIYDGKAATLSISASEDLAAGGYSDGELSQTVVWSDKDDAWLKVDSKHPKGDVLFTKDQLLLDMENVFNTKGIKFHPKKNKMTVTMKTAEVKFNLAKMADWLFFSELAVIQRMYEKIVSKPQIVKDGAPDVYMFGISSLKGLLKKYGVKSPQVKAAIFVLEKFIPEITEKFVNLYNGNILAVELTLKPVDEDEAFLSKDKKDVYDKVKMHLGKQGIDDFHIRYPELHVNNDIVSVSEIHFVSSAEPCIQGFRCCK